MRAIVIDSFGPPSVLQLQRAAVPRPVQGEVLVEVLYAGLNPLDYKMRDGSSGRARGLRLPAILGREFVGRVIHAGPGTDLGDLRSGQLVFGMRGLHDVRGCYAQQLVVDLDVVAPVPDGVTDEQLPAFGGLALVGLTAIAAVEECARIQPGDRVLVHGGSGGVGQLVVAMAKAAGASEVCRSRPPRTTSIFWFDIPGPGMSVSWRRLSSGQRSLGADTDWRSRRRWAGVRRIGQWLSHVALNRPMLPSRRSIA